MGINLGTLSMTVPGHVVRRSKGSDTELEITGAQARWIFETLSEVTHLFPPDEVADEVVAEIVAPASNVSAGKVAS